MWEDDLYIWTSMFKDTLTKIKSLHCKKDSCFADHKNSLFVILA